MRYVTHAALGAAWMLLAVPALAQSPSDVPDNHWARTAVVEMVRLGVMRAPNGRFAGSQTVTRAELAQDLARLARALDAGKRVRSGAPVTSDREHKGDWGRTPVTRYEFAAVLWRAATIAGPALKHTGSTRFGKSEAIEPSPKIALKPSNPAYQDVKYLASKRMVTAGSPILSGSPDKPVNGKDVVGAVSEMLVGLVDQFTDEPQNRIQLEGDEAGHKH